MNHDPQHGSGPPVLGELLDRVRRLEPDYRERRARFFPTAYSLQWFVRCHKARLIRSGALVMHAGQRYADEAKFDAVVMEVAQERAQALIADSREVA